MTPDQMEHIIAGLSDSHGIEIRVVDLRAVLKSLRESAATANAEADAVTELQAALREARETLRDRFAMAALAALPHIVGGADLDARETALAAYQIADAMLAARKATR